MREKVLDYFANHLFQNECELEQKGTFLSEGFINQCGIPVRKKKKDKKTSGSLDEAKLI
jgi:hypothetical protein